MQPQRDRLRAAEHTLTRRGGIAVDRPSAASPRCEDSAVVCVCAGRVVGDPPSTPRPVWDCPVLSAVARVACALCEPTCYYYYYYIKTATRNTNTDTIADTDADTDN